jgi:hypothetical protein
MSDPYYFNPQEVILDATTELTTLRERMTLLDMALVNRDAEVAVLQKRVKELEAGAEADGYIIDVSQKELAEVIKRVKELEASQHHPSHCAECGTLHYEDSCPCCRVTELEGKLGQHYGEYNRGYHDGLQETYNPKEVE